jgi:hypothetical protein
MMWLEWLSLSVVVVVAFVLSSWWSSAVTGDRHWTLVHYRPRRATGFHRALSTSKEEPMNAFKPGAWGFILGSVLTMIVGFTWGGWTTSGSADRLALERSTTAVTAALVPMCLEKSKADPASSKKLTALKAMTSSYEQRDAVLKDGWATFGKAEANREVAEACVSELLKVAVAK